MRIIHKTGLVAGGILGFLGVALGAFGAHALKPFLIENNRLDTFELAVRYQFYHALALLATGVLTHIIGSSRFKYATICFLLGVLFFSGSLYTLCFTGIGVWGAVTPIGGVLLLLGWSFLTVGLLEKK